MTYVFPGGFLGHRKPLEPVLEAFSQLKGTTCGCSSRLRSSAASRSSRRSGRRRPIRGSSCGVGDQPTAEHLRELAACDVCVAPARWEGLGLPLYEAIAFGQPAITNDAPPMNEAIHDDRNGVLVAGHAERLGEVGDPGARPGRRRARARRSSGSPTTPSAAGLAAGAIEVRETERTLGSDRRGA